MENKQLRFFLEICRELSFSKAAKKLFVTQQALSKSIKNLEEELGIPLFYRTHTGIRLTEYGKYLEKKSQHVLEEFDIIVQDIENLKNNERGEVRAAFSYGVMSALSPDLISGFEQNYPCIQLKLEEYSDKECEKAVLSERASMGFTISPIDTKLFDYRVIKRDQMCLIVHQSNPLYHKESIAFSELEREKFIIVNDNFKLHHNFLDRCRTAGFEPDFYHTTMEMILVHKLASANKGIGVSVMFISENIPNTRAIPFQDASCTWEVCLITKQNVIIDHATNLFIDYIANSRGLSVPTYS
ncbi:LysR family transcriptional regulator [Lacrimispora sp.]|uniref:LysR family transcriptional regulator n=1 Tax=Lacrimispora sp. TaxID=2719234 RepID=UPI00289A1B15|nr:LysR family transcriptional regulator [Lacrimispora sp.]